MKRKFKITTLFNPTRPFTHAGKEVYDSSRRIVSLGKNVIKITKDLSQQSHQDAPLDVVQKQGVKIPDDRERFKYYYQNRNWTPDQLRERIAQARRNQATYLLYTAAMLGLMTVIAYRNGANIFSVGMILMCALGVGLFMGGALKFAFHKTQLIEGRLFQFSEFMNRRDMIWKWLNPLSK